MKIGPLSQDTTSWNRYVAAHPRGHVFPPQRVWRDVIARAFNHRTHYLIAEQDGDGGAGVLPLAQVRTRLFGHTLISLPFCVYGGPVAVECLSRHFFKLSACDSRSAAGT